MVIVVLLLNAMNGKTKPRPEWERPINQYLRELARETGRTVMETNDIDGGGMVAFIDGMVSKKDMIGTVDGYTFHGHNYWEEYDATQFTVLPMKNAEL